MNYLVRVNHNTVKELTGKHLQLEIEKESDINSIVSTNADVLRTVGARQIKIISSSDKTGIIDVTARLRKSYEF